MARGLHERRCSKTLDPCSINRHWIGTVPCLDSWHLAQWGHYYYGAINGATPRACCKSFISNRDSGHRRCRYDKTLGPPAHNNHTGLVYAWYCNYRRRPLCLLLYRDPTEHRKQNGIPTICYLKAWSGQPTPLDALLGSQPLDKPFTR